VQAIRLAAEVAETRRGFRAQHGDAKELCRRLQPPVSVVAPGLLEMLADAGELGGKVAEGVGRVHVLDNQVQGVERVEPDPFLAENLDVGLETGAGCLLELGGDALGAVPPDDALGRGDDIACVISLGEREIQVSVLSGQLADLGSNPLGVGKNPHW
jgi:hypothetical protein